MAWRRGQIGRFDQVQDYDVDLVNSALTRDDKQHVGGTLSHSRDIDNGVEIEAILLLARGKGALYAAVTNASDVY